jgi:xylan 1,4-beta-xylosidase
MKNIQSLCYLGHAIAYCLTCSAALAGTVTVDAGSTISETGGNDIEVIRKYCGGASRPAANNGVGNTTSSYLAQVGFNRLLGVNIDTENSVDSSGNFKMGPRLDEVLRDAKAYGYSPHIVPAVLPPDYLINANGPAWNWSQSTWNKYQDYANKFVRFVAREYQGQGFRTAIFEPGNEIDGAEAKYIWTQSNPGGVGSQARYDHFIRMYKIWHDAVVQVQNENPDRQVLIAGQVGTAGAFYSSFNWRTAFIDQVANSGWRLDYFTFHTYGDQDAVGNAPPHPDFGYLKDNVQAIRDKLNSRGLFNTRIGITEWGGSSFTANSVLGRPNYAHEGAAWSVAFFRDVVTKSLSNSFALQARDNNGSQATGNTTLPSLLHIRDSVEYPKPIYNACKVIGLLPGSRRSVSLPSNQPNLVAIASGNANSTGVVVANYNFKVGYADGTFTDSTTTENVTVQLNGLPFSGNAVAQQFLIDANNSNLAKYLDAGQTPSLDGTNLQKVSEVNVTVSNGAVTLPQVTLGKSAVSLWVVQSLNPIANGDYKIVAKHSLKSLDVEGASQSNGAKVQQWTYSGGSNQQWNITSVGNGYYKIISKHTANTTAPKGLDALQGSWANGTSVAQWIYTGGANQQWKPVPVGGGFYKLMPRNAVEAGTNGGLDIDITGGIKGLDGARTILWSNGSNDNQLFRLDSP